MCAQEGHLKRFSKFAPSLIFFLLLFTFTLPQHMGCAIEFTWLLLRLKFSADVAAADVWLNFLNGWTAAIQRPSDALHWNKLYKTREQIRHSPHVRSQCRRIANALKNMEFWNLRTQTSGSQTAGFTKSCARVYRTRNRCKNASRTWRFGCAICKPIL